MVSRVAPFRNFQSYPRLAFHRFDTMAPEMNVMAVKLPLSRLVALAAFVAGVKIPQIVD